MASPPVMDAPSSEGSGAAVLATSPGAPVVELAQFVASWDPNTAELSFALEAPAIDGTAARGIPQALYCERRLTGGRPDTFGLGTVAGSIGYTPGECGLPDAFPYSATGAFCATVAVTSYLGDRAPAVYAEVTGVVPDTGYNGYRFPFGTGADPSTVVAGANQPSDAAGGLWAYGALEPGETVTLPWVLQYEPGPPFWLSGRVLAAVPERINGVDDNCDGEVDELPYADGEVCADGTMCFSGRCNEASGLCVSTCPPNTWGPSCAPCDCDDGNECTSDACDAFGVCSNAVVPDGDACSSCVGGSCVCSSGTCSSGAPAGFVRIEAGTFTMGSPSGELGRLSYETQHSVTLTRDFYLQATEVTQAQWQSLMGNNPSNFGGCPTCPVETVNWWEAVAYVNALSAAEGLPACYTLTGCGGVTPGNDMECSGVAVTVAGGDPYACTGYRLPTESEWEYAARAGTTTATYAGNLTSTSCSDSTLLSIAWFCGNSGSQTQPVGGKVANAWGLYDMLGNVLEWTWDWYGRYPSSATDPTGATRGPHRVDRGGSWIGNAQIERAAYRDLTTPGSRSRILGFRPARTAP